MRVPGVMKGASVSKIIQRGSESVLLTDRMSIAYLTAPQHNAEM